MAHSINNEVALAYDRWSRTYDTQPNQTRELAASVLRQQNLQLTDRQIVEIGCGSGRNTEWLAERAAHVIALDFSAEMLNLARARASTPNTRFLQHDIRSTWPIETATADLVVAMLVLEHVEELAQVFAEAVRVLRGNGELFICELHPFRQMSGRQAEFVNQESNKLERVAAWLHDVSDYVNTGLREGFELLQLGEWRHPEASPTDLPRILSIHFRM